MSIFKSLSPALEHSYTVKALDAHRLVLQSPEKPDEVLSLELEHISGAEYLLKDHGEQHPIYIHQMVDRYQVMYQGIYYILQKHMRGSDEQSQHSGDHVQAPLTGKVIQVNAVIGQAVERGDTLVVLESMKMETALVSPRAGIVESVHCHENEQVANEQILVKLAPAETA
jgi:acetyl/propionyl-CoA carboxylase alpha subunit